MNLGGHTTATVAAGPEAPGTPTAAPGKRVPQPYASVQPGPSPTDSAHSFPRVSRDASSPSTEALLFPALEPASVFSRDGAFLTRQPPMGGKAHSPRLTGIHVSMPRESQGQV